MKEIKRKLALVLTVCMVLNIVIPAYADEIAAPEEPVVQQEVIAEDSPVVENEAIAGERREAANEDTQVIEEEAFEEVVPEETISEEATPEEALYEDVEIENDLDEATPSDEEIEETTAPATPADAVYAFIRETVVDGVKITIIADEGVFPEDAELFAAKVEDSDIEEAIDKAVEENKSKEEAEKNIASKLQFDIKMFHNGEEIQPDMTKGTVKVSFSLEETLNDCLEVNVYHVTGDDESLEAEALETEVVTGEEVNEEDKIINEDSTDILSEIITEGTVVSAEIKGFSYYVVEFAYNSLEYALNVGSSVKVSEILAALNISEEVATAIPDNEEYLAVGQDADGDLAVTAVKEFTGTQKLTVNENYVIDVTAEAGKQVVEYLDENGEPQSHLCTVIDSNPTDFPFAEDGWYAILGTVTVENRIENNAGTSNPAHLILTDNCQLIVSKGIHNESGKVLSIYGQTDNSGILLIDKTATNNAGIGGDNNQNGGTITINGGTVTATGGDDAAGIGGGSGGAGGTIIIRGGIVNATGKMGGPGIGGGKGTTGGQGYSGGEITISGGIVNATGSSAGAGIGGGENVAGGEITISGGIVNATSSNGGAGIGGGHNGPGGTITISGGTVNASSGIKGAGIGGGICCPGGEITISGGIVTASSRDSGAGIGGGGAFDENIPGGSGGTIRITGGILTAVGGKQGAAGIGGGGITTLNHNESGGDGGTITISGGTVTAIGGNNEDYSIRGAGIGGGDKCQNSGTISFENDPVKLKAGESETAAGDVKKSDYINNRQNFIYVYINLEAPYCVKHMKQTVIDGDVYEEFETETLYGVPGKLTEATPNNYEGYSPLDIDQRTISIEGTTVVEVKYNIIYNKITFDPNGHGTAPNPIKATPGTAIYEPTVLPVTGWLLSGWYREQDCTNKFTFDTMPSEDITLYAKWLFVVTFDAQDGSGGTESVSVEGKYSDMPAIIRPTRLGYTFEGYFASTGGGGRRYYNYDGTPAWYCDFDGPKTLYAYWISGSEPTHLHTPELVMGKAAACTADGWKDYFKCTDSGCNKLFADPACSSEITSLETWESGDGKIAATGHSTVHIPQKDSTTEAYGYLEHWYCSNCRKYYSDSTCSSEIGDAAALETWKAGDGRIEKKVVHTHTFGEATYYWSEDLAHCTGYHTCTESSCQYTEFETVETVIGETQYTATFTKSGFTSQYKDIPIPTHVHTFAEGWTSNAIAHWHAATCTHTDIVSGFASHSWGTGESANKCTECGYEKAAPAHVHTPKTILGQKATCTADGWKDYYQCTGAECIMLFSDPACTIEIASLDTWKSVDGKIAATGHSTIHIPQKDSTTEAYGYLEHWYCGNCKKYYADSTCSGEIGDADALEGWKNGDGRIEKKEPGQLYTIKWINDDGTLLKTVQLEEGKLPSYGSKPSKTGYIFTGWTPEIVLVAGDATYKATYEKKSSGGGGSSGSGGSGGGGGDSTGGPSNITYEDKPAVTPITVAANGAQMMGTAVVSIPAAQLAKSGLAPAPGAWSKANGMWVYTKADGNKAKNEWVLISVAGGNASYFYFDSNGNMVTGWQQVGGKWMYFNNESGSLLGACLRGPGRTPDGYEIDASGAWTGR